MQRLYEAMYRLLDQMPVEFHRYLYDQIKWDNRMLGIVGPRGVGKTTLMLQHLRESHATDEALYVSADNMYFTDHSLFDVAEDLVRNGGRYFYIDEVHKYPEWSRELKAMYDSLPGLHVYFTGSSVLDIEKGQADLSRRAPKYVLQGLSFREYLAIVYGLQGPCLSLDQILAGGRLLPEVEHPLPLFKDYLRRGYYPFGTDLDFETELEQVIVRTLESDIPQFAEMTAATGRKLLKLMSIVSTLAPFKPNMTKLASQIQASRNSMEDYLLYMEKAGMIAQLRTGASGLGALGKVEKIYLDNPNIMYVLEGENLDIGNVRETFFFNQMRVKYPVTASGQSDFEIQGATFEVGGKSKTQDQLKDVERGYVVKDDIEYGHGNVVPLWAFGLTY
ncbi:ATP-binding protein [Paratractidigestivibacter sp.]|uniref:ATP-binding protein n=1 Tax=Paratractidigestivibacter sp. TaxID=2847316 RepID=UPI002AC95E0A|nr:AAA family ATPase [Paratractidigestivibacter sp.]